jgi:hypothetical protein
VRAVTNERAKSEKNKNKNEKYNGIAYYYYINRRRVYGNRRKVGLHMSRVVVVPAARISRNLNDSNMVQRVF